MLNNNFQIEFILRMKAAPDAGLCVPHARNSRRQPSPNSLQSVVSGVTRYGPESRHQVKGPFEIAAVLAALLVHLSSDEDARFNLSCYFYDRFGSREFRFA